MSKVERIKRALNRLEYGGYSEFDIYACCEYIGWLAKFKKLSVAEINDLAEQATRILNNM